MKRKREPAPLTPDEREALARPCPYCLVRAGEPCRKFRSALHERAPYMHAARFGAQTRIRGAR